MQRSELITRHFEDIVRRLDEPKQTSKAGKAPAASVLFQRPIVKKELTAWLKNDVAPWVHDFTNLSEFRDLATWPIREFATGASTDGRRLLQDVEEAIKDLVQEFNRLCDVDFIRNQFATRRPMKDRGGIKGMDKPHTSRKKGSAAKDAAYDHRTTLESVSQDLLKLRFFRARPIGPFSSEADYFFPQAMVPQFDGSLLMEGLLTVDGNPEIRPVGNTIVDTLLQRVTLTTDWLERMIQFLRSRIRSDGPIRTQLSLSYPLLGDVKRRSNTLRAYLSNDRQMTLVTSCVALTQTYAAFYSNPDLDWLGLPSLRISHGIRQLKRQILGQRSFEALSRVTVAIGNIRALGLKENDASNDELVQAIASGCLVLQVEKQKAYWEKKPLPISRGNNWDLIVKLAKAAHHRAGVSEANVFEKAVSDSTFCTLVGRLKKCLPSNLAKRIQPRKTQKRTYQLDLEPHQVFFHRNAKKS